MRLSVITINYNNAAGLERTMQSVLSQSNSDFEYIVVDGGSTDGSVGVIESHQDKLGRWVSEKDRGIYHAMNKGVKMASGDYCLFINSGDELIDAGAISRVLGYLDGTTGIITGYTLAKDEKGKPERYYRGSPETINSVQLVRYSLSHPSSFIKRDLLTEYPYDETLKIVSDWKFFCEVLLYPITTYKHIDVDVALFERTGVSQLHPERVSKERQAYLEKIMPQMAIRDLEALDPETIDVYRTLKYNFRLKKLLLSMMKLTVRLSKLFHK